MNFNDNFKSFLKKGADTPSSGPSKRPSDDIEQLEKSLDSSSIADVQDQPETDLGGSQKVEAKKFLYSSKIKVDKSKGISKAESNSQIHITYQDMLHSCNDLLSIIHHEPSHGLPLIHKLDSLDLQSRVKTLMDSHDKSVKLSHAKARKSLYFAPFSKPIDLGICSSHGEMDVEEPPMSPSDQFSTTRSGRLIKRKNYAEGFDNDDYSNLESANKKNKFDDLLLDDSEKITLDSKYIPEKDIGEVRMTNITREEKGKSLKSQNSNQNNNVTVRKGRSETIMQQAKLQNELKMKDEDEFIAFETTIRQDDSSDSDFVPEETIRRRITPPKAQLKKRALVKSQRSTQMLDFDEVVKIAKANNPKKQIGKTSRSNTSKQASEEKVACPICQQTFPKDTIVGHAANCEFEEPANQSNPGSSNSSRTNPMERCMLCGLFFPMPEYEIHVRLCMSTAVSDL